MKTQTIYFSLLLVVISSIIACSSNNNPKDQYVILSTSSGDIKIKLYNDTPLHRDNMITLVKQGFYDGVKFHRVINEFMVQAGDPMSKEGMTEEGASKYDYTVPAEILPHHFHKKGVIAAARVGDRFNPERASSGTQFYIVQGRKFNNPELDNITKRVNATLQQGIFYKNLVNERKRVAREGDNMTDAEIQEFATVISYDEINEMEPFSIDSTIRKIYSETGGTPHLDMQYTVFGELVEGLEIIDSIAAAETDQYDKPLTDILIIKARLSKK